MDEVYIGLDSETKTYNVYNPCGLPCLLSLPAGTMEKYISQNDKVAVKLILISRLAGPFPTSIQP